MCIWRPNTSSQKAISANKTNPPYCVSYTADPGASSLFTVRESKPGYKFFDTLPPLPHMSRLVTAVTERLKQALHSVTSEATSSKARQVLPCSLERLLVEFCVPRCSAHCLCLQCWRNRRRVCYLRKQAREPDGLDSDCLWLHGRTSGLEFQLCVLRFLVCPMEKWCLPVLNSASNQLLYTAA